MPLDDTQGNVPSITYPPSDHPWYVGPWMGDPDIDQPHHNGSLISGGETGSAAAVARVQALTEQWAATAAEDLEWADDMASRGFASRGAPARIHMAQEHVYAVRAALAGHPFPELLPAWNHPAVDEAEMLRTWLADHRREVRAMRHNQATIDPVEVIAELMYESDWKMDGPCPPGNYHPWAQADDLEQDTLRASARVVVYAILTDPSLRSAIMGDISDTLRIAADHFESR